MTIAAIKEAVSLPALIGEYVNLRMVGKEHIALCPFHKEDTPSLRIHDTWFKCFGCGARGDCFTFMAKIESVSIGRAIKLLSLRTGIPLDGKPRTRVQRVYDRQEKEFAEWWQARLLRSLEKELTAYCIHGTEEERESRGIILQQVRALKGVELRALVARAATEQDRREWVANKKDAEWWTGWIICALTGAN